MRQNRKVSRRRSVIGMHVMHIGAVVVTRGVMVVLNTLAESSCGQLMTSIGQKDRTLTARQAEFERVSARWEATKSTDNLNRALGRRGLEMNYAKAHQIIHVEKNGTLRPGQQSVALARQRFDRLATASVAPSRRPIVR